MVWFDMPGVSEERIRRWRLSVTMLPVFALILCFVVLSVCLHLATVNRHYPKWLAVPFVSMTGYRAPEGFLYSWGFGAVSLLLLATTMVSRALFFDKLEERHGPALAHLGQVALWSALIAVGSLAVQGFCGLQDDMIKFIDDSIHDGYTLPKTAVQLGLKVQNKIHLVSAASLFLSGATHCCVMTNIFMKINSDTTRRTRGWKLFCACVQIHSIFAFLLAYTWMRSVDRGLYLMCAVAQWIFVSSLLLFFASYALDFYSILYGNDEVWAALGQREGACQLPGGKPSAAFKEGDEDFLLAQDAALHASVLGDADDAESETLKLLARRRSETEVVPVEPVNVGLKLEAQLEI